MRQRPAKLLVPLAQHRAFWKVRHFWDRLTFYCSRFMFYQRERVRISREDLSIFLSILRSVSFYTLVIAVFLICTELAEHFLIARGWEFGFLKASSDRAYASTDYALQTLTGIQGVFLAVYFTAVSVVAGAIYAEVPHEVRMLLARDRWGSFFLKFIAAWSAVSLLLLGSRGLGWTTGKMVLLFSVLAGCYSIFAMFVVLRNSITLFDPARVGNVIFQDLAQAARSASIEGFAWGNRSFQVGYSNQAAQSLKTLRMVIDVCVEKPNSGNRPLSNLMAATLRAWGVYAYFRGRIPFESGWYRSLIRHKRWLLTEDMEVSLALNTQTTLQAETRKDRNWFEAELLKLLDLGLTAIIDRGDVIAAHERLLEISSLVGGLARELDTTNLGSFQAIAVKMADHWSHRKAEKGGPTTARDQLEEIGLVDSVGMIPLSASLGLREWADEFDFAALAKKVRETDWSNKKAAYRCGLPYGSLADLEKLQEELAFEIAVEGKRITPDWYVEERILLGFMRALDTCITYVTGAVDGVFLKPSSKLFESKRYRACSALVLRGLEFLAKLSHTLSSVKKVVDGVHSRSKIKDLPWPAFDVEELRKLLVDSRIALLRILGKLVPILSLLPDDTSLPDDFGACYVHVLEVAFSGLIQDDDAQFKEFFPIAFRGGLAAYDKLQEHVADWNRDAAIIVRADVLIDILDLGSYAYFFSEYRGKHQYWDVCVTAWDAFLSKHDDPDRVATLMVNLVNFRSSHVIMSPRGTYRFNWEREVTSYLNHEGALVEMFYVHGQKPKPHPHRSKLVRRICTTGGMGIHWPGPDIFLIAYFEKHRKLGAYLTSVTCRG